MKTSLCTANGCTPQIQNIVYSHSNPIQIYAKDVDFWEIEPSELEQMESEKLYPPRFVIDVCGTQALTTSQVWVYFSGMTNEFKSELILDTSRGKGRCACIAIIQTVHILSDCTRFASAQLSNLIISFGRCTDPAIQLLYPNIAKLQSVPTIILHYTSKCV